MNAQVAVVGAGPIGMTLAGRLAQRGVRVLLLEQEAEHVGEGSKAICMQRETLEIWSRLGIGERVAARGVQWHLARTYFHDRELFSVRLPGDASDHFPPFVNISQSEVEEMLLTRLAELPQVDLRWGHRLRGMEQDSEGVTVTCETPRGEQTFRVAYLVGTDGAHSQVRSLLGAGFPGHSHEDLFLICDIRAELPFPNERRLFFDPPWNPGRQVLVHPQPDRTWRIDWQVPPETDPEAERSGGGLDRRIRAVIGPESPYELVWMTAYRFHQRLVEHFRVGRAFLAGDAAHLMSPFGARGLNSGAADAENLAWKLAEVVAGRAPDALLATYETERRAAALENLAVTDATMRFMVPHGPLRRVARDLTLRGSVRSAWFRRRVNSGRLAQPSSYAHSPIVAAGPAEPDLPRHGEIARDVPIEAEGPAAAGARRLFDLLGAEFALLLADRPDENPTGDTLVKAAVRAARDAWPTPVRVLVAGPARHVGGVTLLRDPTGDLRRTYGAHGPRAWLIRPDAYLVDSRPIRVPQDVDALPALLARAIESGARNGARG